jgi:hypothetical protein
MKEQIMSVVETGIQKDFKKLMIDRDLFWSFDK